MSINQPCNCFEFGNPRKCPKTLVKQAIKLVGEDDAILTFDPRLTSPAR